MGEYLDGNRSGLRYRVTIQAAADGTISVKAISTDLLVQGTDTLVFNCGNA